MESAIRKYGKIALSPYYSTGKERKLEQDYTSKLQTVKQQYQNELREISRAKEQELNRVKANSDIINNECSRLRNENGVKYVQVSVNGVGFEMIFDTGCSGALISAVEANYLYQKGKLSPDDILGTTQSQIADGSIVENMVVNLKEVVINNQITCSDVQATVSNNINAPLLLGNEVLDRLATIKIDNEHEALIFQLKQQ